MRSTSVALQAFIASRQPFHQADLFTFSLRSGTTLRLTGADLPVTCGATWLPASGFNFALTRKSWRVQNTMDVPEMEIRLTSSGTDYAGGENVKLAIHNGLFDGAWIELDRIFMPAATGWGDTSLGIVPVFAGPCGKVQVDGLGATITVHGANIRHQQYMPRNRFLTSCIHALYDAGCGASRSAHSFAGTVASASVAGIAWAADPTGGLWANLPNGILTVTSGAGEGQTRTVGSSSATGVGLIYPFYQLPGAGDAFTVTFGCDKTLATCTGRFANQQNYRGFPYVPPAETAT